MLEKGEWVTGRIQEGAAGADAAAVPRIAEPLPSLPDRAARLPFPESSMPGRAVRLPSATL